MKQVKRFIPLGVILILMLSAYFSGALNAFTFDNMKDYRHQLKEFVAQHYVLAPLIFILLYVVIAALSLPVGIYLTFLSGFLFSQPLCTLYVIIGATLGASIIFLAAKWAFTDFLHQRAASYLSQMEAGFQKNAVSYMLFLRLIPAFPFWLVNLAPAFFGISFFTFFWTTAIGIIPATFVFTQAGSGLGAIFDNEGAFTLQSVLNRDVKIALCALGIFALLPLIYRYLKSRKAKIP